MTKAAELAKMGEVLTNSQIGGRRNIVINGAMQVAQRSTSESSITTSGYKALDRFNVDLNSAGTWTISQDTNTPSGFGSSMKFLCTAADASLGSGDRIAFRQFIEGQNVQQLKKGTSDAELVTASFYVKSNKTGTYVLELYDHDNSRHINKSYTVSSADTWEYKTITFEADTTGVLDNDNATSFHLHFWLGSGSSYSSGTLQTSWGADATNNRAVGNVNLADAVDNYWQITGVQLEVGEQATPFEHRSYGEELALCQRYYETSYVSGATIGSAPQGSGAVYANAHTTSVYPSAGELRWTTRKRATPSVTIYNSQTGTVNTVYGHDNGVNTAITAVNAISENGFGVFYASGGGFSAGYRFTYHYTADSEL
jgi:hypothetical protein